MRTTICGNSGNSVVTILLLLLTVSLFFGCEDTNIAMMTEAASDAVTAVTLTDQDVKSLARRAADMSDRKSTVAPLGNSYDQRLQRLVKDHTRKDGHTFNFKVYLTKEVNAFAMADGTIRVYSGLMDLMNDSELLFVIGHEMGHVVLAHSKKQVLLAYATSALRKGLASQENEVGEIARSVIGSFVERLTHAQFSQHEEREADQYGVNFLRDEGLDVSGAVSALNILAALARKHTFLSSHPDPEERAKILLEDNQVDEDESLVKRIFSAIEYLGGLCLKLLRWVTAWITGLF